MNRPEQLITYKGKIIARSKAANLLLMVPENMSFDQFNATDESEFTKEWFPLSQTRKITEAFSFVNGTFDVLVVTEWIAKQKGLVS